MRFGVHRRADAQVSSRKRRACCGYSRKEGERSECGGNGRSCAGVGCDWPTPKNVVYEREQEDWKRGGGMFDMRWRLASHFFCCELRGTSRLVT